jgi:hypothetical protein
MTDEQLGAVEDAFGVKVPQELVDVVHPPKSGKKKPPKKPADERGPRQVGTWVARQEDGTFTVWTSELQARRAAVHAGRVVFTPFGEVIRGESGDTSKPGVWLANREGSDAAPFQRELGALRFAVPDSDVQFLQNGGKVGQ